MIKAATTRNGCMRYQVLLELWTPLQPIGRPDFAQESRKFLVVIDGEPS
jgi:hypothetical protein